jgi:tetratricopeptide (TPR) repeat protein
MKALSVFTAMAIAFAADNAPVRAQTWGPPLLNRAENLRTGRELSATRCQDIKLSPAERVEQCKANTASGGSESWIALGEALQDTGDFPSAIHAYTMALGSPPPWQGPTVYIMRGESFALNGQYDKALEDANAALDEDKTIGFAGRCWVRAIAGQDLSLALDDCDAALSYVRHDNMQVQQARALIHFKQGDLKAALDDCTKALVIDERLNWALYMCAVVQRKLGNTAAADSELSDALRSDRFIVDIYAQYGVPRDTVSAKQ